MSRFAWLSNILGANRTPPANGDDALQAINRANPLRPATERSVLEARRDACTCVITVANQGKGTGILVGPDLVLTNYHVVADDNANLQSADLIKCRFGFFEAGEFKDGTHKWVPLNTQAPIPVFSAIAPGDRRLSLNAADYLDPQTGEYLYDYALLQLAQPVGNSPGRGASGQSLNPLGWIGLSGSQTLPSVGQPLLVVQFPERSPGSVQAPAQTSDGLLEEVVGDGLRARHGASTRRGSSGSGVFDGRVQLIGLHNAGRETDNKFTDNRFIPINRILDDIKRKNAALYDTLVTASPPALSSAGLTARTAAKVNERVKAAKVLLDREREHGVIVDALSAGTVQVNHVVCRSPDDAISYFAHRLRFSAGLAENLPLAKIMDDFLRGQAETQGSFVPWRESSVTWPSPGTSYDQAKRELKGQFIAQLIGARTLLVVKVDQLDERSRDEELEYIRAFGEVISSYAESGTAKSETRQPMLQALIVYQNFSDVDVDPKKFVPLWQAAPPRCGVSIELPKVSRSDIEAWITRLNNAWSLVGNELEIPRQFGSKTRLSMSQVMELLENPLVAAATAHVETMQGISDDLVR